ncbi:hypothetical protein BU16DRAFT_561305 [Lophium mytilinum]|uniref:SAM domain-containing protein n=1 Tax=Lophium mytilinum TaxID=390894 RepID=A0A6A6QXE5_9PEZI|nr:hypothetical protein BU16DRAFT_561305 [Lophium mytilinum]
MAGPSSSFSPTGETSLRSPAPIITEPNADSPCTLWALGLSEYLRVLRDNGFWDVDTLLEITDDDMTELGFNLGHQRIMQRETAAAALQEKKSRIKPESMALGYLSRILNDLFLYRYKATLENNEFHNWPTVLEITEGDLKQLGFKIGHRRLLQREIAIARGRSGQGAMESKQLRRESCGNDDSVNLNSCSFAYRLFAQQGLRIPKLLLKRLHKFNDTKTDTCNKFLCQYGLSPTEETQQLFWMFEASKVQRVRNCRRTLEAKNTDRDGILTDTNRLALQDMLYTVFRIDRSGDNIDGGNVDGSRACKISSEMGLHPQK